jgi:hypothetical protein
MSIPGMTEDIADSIIDWRDTDEIPTGTGLGAESDYYLALSEPYYAKNQPFEAVEELLLVKGIDKTYLYGDGTAPPKGTTYSAMGSSTAGGLNADMRLSEGWFDLFTVYSTSPNTGGGGGAAGTIVTGRINVNTAPREVLMCLQFGNVPIEASEVEAIVGQRAAVSAYTTTDTTWLTDAIGARATQLATQITGESYRYSADILGVSRNGRAFKRVQIVIDTSDTTVGPKIIHRRDMTDRGWPMDETVLQELQHPGAPGVSSGSTNGGVFR